MKEFIMENWLSILLVLAIAGYAIYLAATRQTKKLMEIAYALMLQAERAFADGQGKEKFEFVFGKFYGLLPVILRQLFTEEVIRKKLQEWYDLAKDYLDNGVIDGSTKSPPTAG